MAEELGRIESKLDHLLEGAPDGVPGPDWLEALRALLDLILGAYAGGRYTITSACHVDADGEPLPPLEASWSGGLGAFDEIIRKLDALAVLQQHQTNLPVHVCRRPPPSATRVNVRFLIDE
jgi:hypothetical protein